MTPLAQILNRNRFSIAFQAPAVSHGIGKTEGVRRGLRGFVEKQAGGGGGGAHDSWAKFAKLHVALCRLNPFRDMSFLFSLLWLSYQAFIKSLDDVDAIIGSFILR